jgi:hypothetical protein
MGCGELMKKKEDARDEIGIQTSVDVRQITCGCQFVNENWKDQMRGRYCKGRIVITDSETNPGRIQ